MTRQRSILTAIVLTALTAVHAGNAFGQTPATAPPRRGGLVPQRQKPTPSSVEPISREELMRRFDLNGDGRIDEGETEIARSRMRQQRAEILRNSSIDPLTGRPRGAPPPESPAKAVDTTPPGSDELLLVPGRPDGIPGLSKGLPPPTAARDPKAAAQGPPTPQPPTAMTGGVRAGAPPVRPGYGALGPKADLNAGRPIGGQIGRPGGTTAGTQGGMPGMQQQLRGLPPQNAARPPRQAGQPGSGGAPGRPTTGRATAAPRPGLFPQQSPRISAEDIGQ